MLYEAITNSVLTRPHLDSLSLTFRLYIRIFFDKKQSLTLWLTKANKDIDLRQLLDSHKFFYNPFTYTTYLKLFDVNVATLMGCILALYHVTIFCSKSHSLDKS
jgi:hypothetical protein